MSRAADEQVPVAELARLLRELGVRDRSLRVFGAHGHRYRLAPPLHEWEVARFEEAQGARLPADYRAFLLELGSCGAGPSYGLEPLERTLCDDPSRPWPLTRDSGSYEAGDPELRAWMDCGEDPGLLELCHHGCAFFSYLVVNGPTYGTMWNGGDGAYFMTGCSFSRWYAQWAERALRVLDNERHLTLLRPGMPRAAVEQAVPAAWQLRVGCDGTRYFEATEIPAQLVLDDHDSVRAVKPWHSI